MTGYWLLSRRVCAKRFPRVRLSLGFGGDEFTVLLQGTIDDAVVVARRIVDALRSDRTADTSVSVGASVGVAQFELADEPLSAHALLRRADAAMYEAKRSGKGAVVVYGDRRKWLSP